MSRAPAVLVVHGGDACERRQLESVLSGAGYEVRESVPVDALEKALRDPPDLILIDLPGPPDAAPGLCARLRSEPRCREASILVLAPGEGPAMAVASLDSGADDFLSKPFATDELLARVRAALRGKALADGLRDAGSFYLDLFSRMAATVTSPFRLDEDLARILAHALEAIGAGKGRLLLFDPHRDRLEVRAAAGEAPADALQAGSVVPEGPPPPGVLRIPLVARGDPLGALEIDRRGLPPPSPEREKLLSAIAAQAVMFVENVRLNREVRRMFLDVIISLAGAVDAKDSYTHGHAVRVARISLLVGKEAGLRPAEREALLLAALLHDIGKIGVPDSVLKKPSRLDGSEADLMRDHPVIGAQMLRHIRALRDSLPGIRHHHEHWDGSGYPDRLIGDAIPLAARIILVADAFDAMTSDRIYRPGLTIDTALGRMAQFRSSQFDPDQFDRLRRLCDEGVVRPEDCRTTPDLFGMLRAGA